MQKDEREANLSTFRRKLTFTNLNKEAGGKKEDPVG